MFQIVRQRGSFTIRLDRSPLLASFEDAQNWLATFLKENPSFLKDGVEHLEIEAIAPEARMRRH